MAEAPMVKSQSPGYYRMMLGKFEVTALLDGCMDLDAALLRDISETEVQKMLARGFIGDLHKIPITCNAYLVNTGSKLIMIDAGGGQSSGAVFGGLPANLKAAGYAPEQVDIILITHLHPDHFGGLLSADGNPAYPKATVYLAKAENDFWTSDEEPNLDVPPAMKEHFTAARKLAKKTAEQYLALKQWKTFENTDLPVADVKAVPLPGHTPGHTGYEIASEGKSLLAIGDAIHVGAVQFPHPEAAVSFDADSPQAVSVRKALFHRLAGSQTIIACAHISFPGLGHLREEAENSYVWVPLDYSLPPKNEKATGEKK
jgi:glyoxylase-like metal-dependent hydrolase (beta-lactamase superfamily II)